jgi:hypothetical protein
MKLNEGLRIGQLGRRPELTSNNDVRFSDHHPVVAASATAQNDHGPATEGG